MRLSHLAFGLCWLILHARAAAAATDQFPAFQIRARIAEVAGQPPLAAQKFSIRLRSLSAVTQGGAWSSWISYDPPVLDPKQAGYVKSWPAPITAAIGGLSGPAIVEAELVLNETAEKRSLKWELFGPNLGLIFWRDSLQRPHAATLAEYNRRYWKEIAGRQIPDRLKPKKFPIIDRFIGGDDDRIDWLEGMKNLSSIGVNTLLTPPSKAAREALQQAGLTHIAWAIYCPPGYTFPSAPGPKSTPSLANWASAQAKSFLDQGFRPADLALFSMSDEPGWYFPSQYAMLQGKEARSRFEQYLESNALLPGDFGRSTWAAAEPLGRARAHDLPSKRLFYWTQRFFSSDSARYFAECTRALEQAFYPGLPIATNWNFFSGRLFVPGPVANNPDKLSPDAAMGGQDWFEFARLRGGTQLWTEDWFPDSQAYQWSFYAAKLRPASEKSGLSFGGYVVPRASGDREDGLQQKILSVIGGGGKAIESYVFGPEYTFPGNCYSDLPDILSKLAKTYRMIGAAEDVLWPGKRPSAQVAILSPRSTELWDAAHLPQSVQIQDATNTNLNGETVDYMAEVADLYLALQHANIPADFVDEDSLSLADELRNYRVLYITEPDIPKEAQQGLVQWVRGGGTLVSILNAGAMDRYDEPSPILASLGFSEKERERLYIGNLETVEKIGLVHANDGPAPAYGARGALAAVEGEVTATFEDGSPAILHRQVGKGSIVHFTWLPGLSYAKSANTAKSKLPWNFSPVIRNWIVAPALAAGVEPPVKASMAMVETPLLLSTAGAAITVLNWNNEPVRNLELAVQLPFPVKAVASVLEGPIKFRTESHLVRFSMPVKGADIVTLRR